jgi:hypothetical protein
VAHTRKFTSKSRRRYQLPFLSPNSAFPIQSAVVAPPPPGHHPQTGGEARARWHSFRPLRPSRSSREVFNPNFCSRSFRFFPLFSRSFRPPPPELTEPNSVTSAPLSLGENVQIIPILIDIVVPPKRKNYCRGFGSFEFTIVRVPFAIVRDNSQSFANVHNNPRYFTPPPCFRLLGANCAPDGRVRSASMFSLLPPDDTAYPLYRQTEKIFSVSAFRIRAIRGWPFLNFTLHFGIRPSRIPAFRNPRPPQTPLPLHPALIRLNSEQFRLNIRVPFGEIP